MHFRTPYRSAYDGAISANTLKSYMTSISLPTTSMAKIQPNFRFQPSKQYDELSYDDSKSCTEKNMTLTTKESIITVPQSLRPIEIISSNMSPKYNILPITPSPEYNILPISPTPIVPYVSHTYFTLDDVIIPSSSDNILYYKPERKERIVKETPPPASTQRSKLSETLTADIHNADLFDIMPMEKSTNRVQTTMPAATIIVKNETNMDTKSVFLNQNLPSDVFNIISELRNFTSFPNFKTISNPKDEICDSCEKDLLTTTLNTILNDVDDKKLEELIEAKEVKTVTENIIPTIDTLKSLKSPTSTTFMNLLATKLKIAQNHKKFLTITSKKNSYTSHSVSTSTTSSTEAPQPRKSRRTKTYSRQRKVDSNTTRLNNYSLSNAKATYSKILRPTTKSITKQKIQSQNVTEIPSTTTSTSPKPETKKPITIRNTPISRSVSRSNVTETTALAAESAIMTISNANGRNLRGSMPAFRKRLPDPHKGLVHTTAIPQLPIELYFNKLTRTQ